MKKICILTSGMSRGSNFEAIYKGFQKENIPVKIDFVVITKKKAPIITKCNLLNIDTIFISTKKMRAFEEFLLKLIKSHKIDLIVLAGFMLKISEDFIDLVPAKIVNIHPALLPKFGGKGMYGMNVHEAVYEAKEKYSGATVHFVNSEYDKGEIILQEKIDISSCNSAEEIAKKVLTIEHQIYYRAIKKVLLEQE